jgi:hypothetical protein
LSAGKVVMIVMSAAEAGGAGARDAKKAAARARERVRLEGVADRGVGSFMDVPPKKSQDGIIDW